MATGGYSDIKDADADVIGTFNVPHVFEAVAEAIGTAVTELDCVSFRTQVVAGTNFKLLAKAGDKMVIISAFRPLPHTGEPLKVNSVVEGTEL